MPQLLGISWQYDSSIMTLLTEIFGGDEPQTPLTLYQVADPAVLVYLIGIAVIMSTFSVLRWLKRNQPQNA